MAIADSYVIHCIYKLYLYIRAGFETKHFSSWEEFTRWKESEEESTHTYFVQPKGEEVSHVQEKSNVKLFCVS